jgi:3-dehydroquinate dehydratase/shikimate dehydrogenase
MGHGAGIIKFAYLASDACDNRLAFDFLALARADRQRSIAIAMGEAGEPSRILYKKFGGWGTYAAPDDTSIAAPGQIPASRLVGLYRSEDLSPSTRVYGVVGGQVRHSKGIFVHNALFARMKLNTVYCRFQVSNLRGFMKDISPLIDGFSVTIPHKESIMKFLSAVDPIARSIGAVNTVIRRKNGLYGTNTDAPGALDAIEKVSRVRGKRMLIVGAGGAARAIAFEASRRGASVIVANRTAGRANALARAFGLKAVGMKSKMLTPSDLASDEFDIVVNATSVGMSPSVKDTPIAASMLRGKVVFDAVYSPPMTRLLREARRAGATIIAGTEMYLNQAIRQSKLFSGRQPDSRLMRRILSKPA